MTIQAHLVEVGHAQQLALRLGRIDDRTQEVEACRELQSLADWSDELHGLGKELGMEIDNTALVDGTVQLIDIVRELDAVVGNDIRGAAGTGCRIVTMLGHLVTSTCNHETAGGGDIEGVLPVATRSHYIDIAVAVERYGNTRL